MHYRIWFYKLHASRDFKQRTVSFDVNQQLADYLEGFWLDSEGTLAKNSNAAYFVPASQIIGVEKL